jgi:F0F1-type ATP synthase assembly protein I
LNKSNLEVNINVSADKISIKKRKGTITPSAIEPSDVINAIILGLMLGDFSAERYTKNGGT